MQYSKTPSALKKKSKLSKAVCSASVLALAVTAASGTTAFAKNDKGNNANNGNGGASTQAITFFRMCKPERLEGYKLVRRVSERLVDRRLGRGWLFPFDDIPDMPNFRVDNDCDVVENPNPEPGADTDQDGLLDSWEINGIDFDNDGIVDLDLPAMGADPNHKDIFTEIDYMVRSGLSGHTHKPKMDALRIAIDAFNNAPVSNPDGTTGIHIHIDAGPNTIMNPVTNETWGERSRSTELPHQNNLGTCKGYSYSWSEFDEIKDVNFSIERGNVFHYNIWAHSLCRILRSTSGMSRGLPGSDLLVSLGGWDGDVGTVGQQAGTFIHEFGHNLALKHGGDNHNAYKPNYLSVMNYFFQTRGLRINGLDGNYDYSRFALPTLDEALLDETIGLMGVAESAGYGTIFYDTSSTPAETVIVNDINAPIDWNVNGDSSETDVNADINNGSGTVHANTDNWEEIVFNGGAIGHLGESVKLTVEMRLESSLVDITKPEDALLPTDFAVSITGPSSMRLAPGQTAVYAYEITNSGDIADTYEVGAISTKGWANLAVLPISKELESGESMVVDIEMTIPDGTLGGLSDLLTVTARSTANTAIIDTIETTTLVHDVYDLCSCEANWKNHGQFMSCVTDAANELLEAELISEITKGEIVSKAAQSGCGKSN